MFLDFMRMRTNDARNAAPVAEFQGVVVNVSMLKSRIN
jgi:hypothetical protein